jgi:hypothetical protein
LEQVVELYRLEKTFFAEFITAPPLDDELSIVRRRVMSIVICWSVSKENPETTRSRGNGLMADAVAFLISAGASVQNLLNEWSCDPQAVRVLASVARTVAAALSTLYDLSETQLTNSAMSGERRVDDQARQISAGGMSVRWT